MPLFVHFTCALIILLLQETTAKDLPSFLHVCHRSDPDLDKCMIQSIIDLRPYLVTGVPEYNIPRLEPLVMTELIKEEVAGMSINTTNVSTYGCSDYTIRSISANLGSKDVVMTLDLDLPKLIIHAQYSMNGKLLLLPVRGNGILEANVTDCVSHTVLNGELYEKEGETYLKFTSVNLKVKLGGGNVKFSNLFNDDKTLLTIMNDVVNRNFDGFMKELMPVIEKSLASVFMDIGNGIVDLFTYEQLYPQ